MLIFKHCSVALALWPQLSNVMIVATAPSGRPMLRMRTSSEDDVVGFRRRLAVSRQDLASSGRRGPAGFEHVRMQGPEANTRITLEH